MPPAGYRRIPRRIIPRDSLHPRYRYARCRFHECRGLSVRDSKRDPFNRCLILLETIHW